MPTKAAAKGKPQAAKRGSAVKQNSFPVQSNLDFPFCDYELKGRPHHQRLLYRHNNKGSKKLSPYELHLLEKHFPMAEKKWMAASAKASKARKAARGRQARSGLVPVGESDHDDGEEGDDTVPVFKRKAPEVLLRKLSTSWIFLIS
jgi:hypothetical protein